MICVRRQRGRCCQCCRAMGLSRSVDGGQQRLRLRLRGGGGSRALREGLVRGGRALRRGAAAGGGGVAKAVAAAGGERAGGDGRAGGHTRAPRVAAAIGAVPRLLLRCRLLAADQVVDREAHRHYGRLKCSESEN